MKHTNLPNEITGKYYNPDRFFDKIDWSVVIGIGVTIAICGIIYAVLWT